MNLQVIKNPAGSYSIVGCRVPVALSYSEQDGSSIKPETAKRVAQFGPGFVKEAKAIVYSTEQDALTAIEKYQSALKNE